MMNCAYIDTFVKFFCTDRNKWPKKTLEIGIFERRKKEQHVSTQTRIKNISKSLYSE